MEGEILCPQSVKDLFEKFNGRRDALIKAITTDYDEFFKQCDPEKGTLCLFGFPSGKWEVNFPAELIPTDLPEPAMGINFARDMMQEEDWVALVSVRSDAWLVSVAHYESAIDGLSQPNRILLFNMMNKLPTVFDTVFDTRRKQGKENAYINKEGTKVKLSIEAERWHLQKREGKKAKKADEQAATEEGGDDDRVLCGDCGEKYTSDELWLCCHFCEKCYHGRCVSITPARAQHHIKRFKCPSCYDRKKLIK